MSLLQSTLTFTSQISTASTNDELVFLEEVFRHFKVERSRALADAARDIIVRTVAWAIPATKVTGLTDGYTAQVCADTQHHKPFRLLGTLGIGLGIAELREVGRVGLGNLIRGAVADEDGLTTPLDRDVLAFRDGGEFDLNLGQGQYISRGGHVGQEILNGGLGAGSGYQARGTDHEVGEGAACVRTRVLLVLGKVGDQCGIGANSSDGVLVAGLVVGIGGN